MNIEAIFKGLKVLVKYDCILHLREFCYKLGRIEDLKSKLK